MSSLRLIARSNPGSVTVHHSHLRARLLAYLAAPRIDRKLAAGISPDSSVTVSLRAETLIGMRARRRLSRSLYRLLKEVKEPIRVVPTLPLCRREILAAADLIDQAADRLLAVGPIDARGVAQIRVLLTDGSGPVYNSPRAADLRPALRAAIDALELNV